MFEGFLEYLAVGYNTGMGNSAVSQPRVPRVRVKITFLIPVIKPIPVPVKPVPARAGFD